MKSGNFIQIRSGEMNEKNEKKYLEEDRIGPYETKKK